MKLHILSAIKKYAKSNPTRFHMPGHIADKTFCKCFKGANLDVTELSVIDNENALSLAEKDVSKILDVNYVKFLTGGSTSGVLSMLLSVKDFGNKIIIFRSSHKSVYAGCSLAGITPVIIPDYNGDDDAFINELLKGLSQDNVIGALFTYPDYYGNTFDIKKVKEIVKNKQKLLLIDNAHGGHFRFIDGLTYAGEYADAWVDGLHKNFCTLNQGAILCANNQMVIDKLSTEVEKILTTSPSYILLSSIEYGEKFLSENTKKLCCVIDKIRTLKEKISALGVKVLSVTDPLKIVVDFSSIKILTVDAEKILEKEKIYAEMVDDKSILFMVSVLVKDKHLKKLYYAIKKAVLTCKRVAINSQEEIYVDKVYDYLTAVSFPAEWVDLNKSCGRIASQNVGLFPPCKPLLIAGEKVNDEIIKKLSSPNVFGIKDGKIKVVKD